MKKMVLISLLFCFKIGICQTTKHSAAIKSSAEKIEQKVIDWQHKKHQNPELGNREIRIAARIKNTQLVSAKTGELPFVIMCLIMKICIINNCKTNDWSWKKKN